jgi:NADH-quinone oxidoreductase subunit I
MSLFKEVTDALKGVGKGMGVVHRAADKGSFTQLYPYELPELPPVSCQSLALITEEDGSDRCVSCLACEKVCPSQVITIERKRNPGGKGFVLERFDIDLVNCMYCAACVEACPVSAIVTIQDFELSTYDLQTLKADKQFLDEQGRRAKQWYSPKKGVEHRTKRGKLVVAPLEEQPGGEALRLEQEAKEAAARAARQDNRGKEEA